MTNPVNTNLLSSSAEPVQTGWAGPSTSTAPDLGATVLVLGLVLKHHRLILGLMVTGLLVAVVLSVVQGPTFVAESSFRPQGRNEPATRFSGIAAQLGFALPFIAEDPLEFYVRLVRSRSVLESVAQSEFEILKEERDSIVQRGDLIAILGIEGDTRAEQLRAAVAALDDMISIQTFLDARMIALRVYSRYPDLAVQINRRIIELVNKFNIEHRRAAAEAEREFVESRYIEAGQQLAAAEKELAEFLERNRSYRSSPQLSFEAARLERQVDLRQQVYVSLAQAYEQARIAEVRNTPVIAVVDPPEGSVKPKSYLVRNLVIGLGLAMMIILLGIAGSEYIAYVQRAVPDQYAELRQRLNDLRGVLRQSRK
jgi:uncharacterized protein involved in exopolysaccharide biosynthesis